MDKSQFELVVQSVRMLKRIALAGRMFSYLRFSEIGVPPGTTEKMLSKPDNYWRKKVDGDRICYEPLGPLRAVHDRIAAFLGRLPVWDRQSLSSTAYWKGSSTVQNGRYHRSNSSSLVLDAKNAFESIRAKHIYRFLLRTRVMLYGPHDKLGYDSSQAWIISRLLTYRGKLRQGSPASPHVFNLLCGRLDRAMEKRLETFHDIVYTRYADDFCFSASAEVFPQEVECAIREVLREHHIVLNERKTRRSGNGILEFPGIIIVRGKIRPPGAYVLKLLNTWHGPYYAMAGKMSENERQGHKNFLHQFGRGGVPRSLKALVR